MSNVSKVLKGVLVGIGAILPGVSGGVIAAAFNIYKDLIAALAAFLRHPIKSILAIWQYLVGIFLGIIIGYLFVSFVFSQFKLPLTFLFIGLILGELPALILEVKSVKIKPSHIIVLTISALLMIAVCFTGEVVPYEITGAMKYVVYFLIGLIMALSFIVPGLSGTMLLMALGFYSLFTEFGSEVLSGVFANIGGLLVIILGVAIGMLVLAKPLNFAIKKRPIHFNYAIIGLVLVSPANILLSLWKENIADINNATDQVPPYIFDVPWYIWLVCGLLLIAGTVLAFIFVKNKDAKASDITNETKEN